MSPGYPGLTSDEGWLHSHGLPYQAIGAAGFLPNETIELHGPGVSYVASRNEPPTAPPIATAQCNLVGRVTFYNQEVGNVRYLWGPDSHRWVYTQLSTTPRTSSVKVANELPLENLIRPPH
jgi:hypothetical protein